MDAFLIQFLSVCPAQHSLVHVDHSRCAPLQILRIYDQTIFWKYLVSLLTCSVLLFYGTKDFPHQPELVGQSVSAFILNLLLCNSRRHLSINQSCLLHSFSFSKHAIFIALAISKCIQLSSWNDNCSFETSGRARIFSLQLLTN